MYLLVECVRLVAEGAGAAFHRGAAEAERATIDQVATEVIVRPSARIEGHLGVDLPVGNDNDSARARGDDGVLLADEGTLDRAGDAAALRAADAVSIGQLVTHGNTVAIRIAGSILEGDVNGIRGHVDSGEAAARTEGEKANQDDKREQKTKLFHAILP